MGMTTAAVEYWEDPGGDWWAQVTYASGATGPAFKLAVTAGADPKEVVHRLQESHPNLLLRRRSASTPTIDDSLSED